MSRNYGWSFDKGRGQTTNYFHDPLGSVVYTVSGQGEKGHGYKYDAFGVLYAGDLANSKGFGYNGKRFSSLTGFYNYGFRHYSPEMKRWVTADPIRDGDNWYIYCRNNPVRFIDMTGLFAEINYNNDTEEVKIQIPIMFFGDGATNENIQIAKDSIENSWSGQIGQYNVTVEVDVLVLGSEYIPPDVWKKYNRLEINDSAGRSGVNGEKPQNEGASDYISGTLYIKDEKGNQHLEGTAIHEAGHLMGHPDKYDYETMIPDKGWEGNVMSTYNGDVEEKNITEIIINSKKNT